MSKIWTLCYYNAIDNTAALVEVFAHKPDYEKLWAIVRLTRKETEQLHNTGSVTLGKYGEHRLEETPMVFESSFGEGL